MSKKISVIGLGYVGLPLATLLASKYQVVGFDINRTRIKQLREAYDSTCEIDTDKLSSVLVDNSDCFVGLYCTNDILDIKDSNYYIVTVPTPVDKYNAPDLFPLYKASETVGSVLKKGDIVIYESTVYPGATEEECVPVLEKVSNLKFNEDFFVGYSPERINPGDKNHTVDKILKVTSGSTYEISLQVDELYKSVISAGTYLAPSIKVAEAAKIIENSQRDINIAFVNELAKIFNLLGINTNDVLDAAATKWNFLPFKPGLVGGHCIGVDPYYLAQKAKMVGFNPEIILAGRRVNDGMGDYIAKQIVKLMIKNDINIYEAKILMLGITFKEDCPDIRNTKVVDIIKSLVDFDISVDIYDPLANIDEVKQEYDLVLTNNLPCNNYDAIVLGVAHSVFFDIDLSKLKKEKCIVYDVKNFLKSGVDYSL
jgi:UDP-N-acetyl-D-galactosamine dehydrogenase